jgi:hypothetical protein
MHWGAITSWLAAANSDEYCKTFKITKRSLGRILPNRSFLACNRLPSQTHSYEGTGRFGLSVGLGFMVQ